MKKLTMMIGLPRSGKSTWVANNKDSEVVISADEFRKLIYGQRFYSEGEGLVWATRDICLKILLQQGVDIIVDETNTIKEYRAKLIKLAKKYGYEVTGVFIDTDVQECIKRANATGQDDLEPVIDRMSCQFEFPCLDEGFKAVDMWTPVGNYIHMQY